jgi:hypothetical protein
MYPGLTDTDCRVAEMRVREMRAEAHWRRFDGRDASCHQTGGNGEAPRRTSRPRSGLIALLLSRRAGGRVGQVATGLRKGAAS